MSKIVVPREKPKYKSTVAIVMKNGVQMATDSICVPEFLWKLWDEARGTNIEFRIEVGEFKRIMKIVPSEVAIIVIEEYDEERGEEKAQDNIRRPAPRSNLTLPPHLRR